ncbi:hypothetical protein OG735_00760 [Streptomyces sp. NBC_01210]|uniref:hypothetical protein n=1 Tax=Streptomyces sp. NBC_01210 TaxID=2903774 RepID=UPI002E1465AF|nr:hypothetical protein OG735_00760 [Streptomyces sp. NBC_01210]
MFTHGLPDYDPFLRAVASVEHGHAASLTASPNHSRPLNSTRMPTTDWTHGLKSRIGAPEQWWSVTMPITTTDERPGTHTFVIWAITAQAALSSAVNVARSDIASKRRRYATIDTSAAVITLWKG